MKQCSECLQQISSDQLLSISGQSVCAGCKNRVIQRLQEGISEPANQSIMRYPLLIFIKWAVIVYISAIVPLLLSDSIYSHVALFVIITLTANWELYLIRKKHRQYKRIMKYTYIVILLKALTQLFPVIEIILGFFLEMLVFELILNYFHLF